MSLSSPLFWFKYNHLYAAYRHVRWVELQPAHQPLQSGWGRWPSFGSSGSRTAECGTLWSQSPVENKWRHETSKVLTVVQNRNHSCDCSDEVVTENPHGLFQEKTTVVIITTVTWAPQQWIHIKKRDAPDHTGAWCCRCPVQTLLFPWRSQQPV